MFLKELGLSGFKSFPEKTTLKFEPGITAIVGPNGCGKSNVFDGIRWVLGEQSTKALRSMKMEDVIFNGTDTKPSLGMAEVTLVFSNKSRQLAFDSDEIEVCRRIFRSGESQYLLNKAPMRLKDILDLFIGTGIGAESYSLVQQGKIDLILSTRPEERRLIFDEASGITKYKSQKREALRKLEDTEQNLMRVNDIIGEVRREINSLERQANKARRYKEVFEELKDKEKALANLEFREIISQRQILLDQVSASEEVIGSHSAEIQQIQEAISSRLQQVQQLDKEISDHHDKLINIDNLINNNSQRIATDNERIEELNSRILDLKLQINEAQGRIVSARASLENFQEEFRGLKQGIQEKETLLLEKEKEYQGANLSIKSSQDKIKNAKERILDLVTNGSRLRNEITDLDVHLKSQILRKKRLDIENIRTKEERQKAEEVFEQHIKDLNDVERELNLRRGEFDQIKDKQGSAFSEQEGLAREIQDLENNKIALESQKEFLQELKLKYEGISQSLNAVLYLDKLPADDITGIVVKVKGAVVPVEKQGEGDSFNLNYKLTGEAKPMPLGTQSIEQKIAQVQAEIDKRQGEQNQVKSRIQGLSQSLEAIEQVIKEMEILLSNKKVQKDNLSEQLDKINQEDEVINLELDDLATQIEQLDHKHGQLEEELNRFQQEQGEQEEAISALDNSIAEYSRLREKNLILITQIKTDIENQSARLEQQEKTEAVLESAYQESQQVYQRYCTEIEDSEIKIKQLSQEAERLNQENSRAEEDKEELVVNQDKQENEFKGLNNLQTQDNNKILSFERDIEGLRKQVYELQIQLKDIDFKDRSIRDRMNQVYKIDLDNIAGSEVSPDESRETLKSMIAEFSRKLDSYGTVNLIAIEEYEELKKRYDFLTQQQNDLVQAKQSLSDVINKINRTTRSMFLDAFKRIQVQFHTYFRLLFGGGEAQVMLIDESDPLESGIEIICRPPGKRLQNVLALSGGEKALSAVALIFAIFKIKPAPFCVLDEIDAALDEINISRFSGILQEFAKTSQFLVITHNRRTIANANVMYGITMQESGISKIVSVKLTHANSN
ncbi:MAG: AAA family ATPase [Candidatus Omnitrophota bacterium]